MVKVPKIYNSILNATYESQDPSKARNKNNALIIMLLQVVNLYPISGYLHYCYLGTGGGGGAAPRPLTGTPRPREGSGTPFK